MPIGSEVTTTNNIYQSYASILLEGASNTVYSTYVSTLLEDNLSNKIYAAYVSVLIPAYEVSVSTYRPRLNHRSFTMF